MLATSQPGNDAAFPPAFPLKQVYFHNNSRNSLAIAILYSLFTRNCKKAFYLSSGFVIKNNYYLARRKTIFPHPPFFYSRLIPCTTPIPSLLGEKHHSLRFSYCLFHYEIVFARYTIEKCLLKNCPLPQWPPIDVAF